MEALDILSRPVNELDLSSDYYKAVFHLLKYPGLQTEQALFRLIESDSNEQAVLIAKRKAVEVLARLNCIRAIPYIGHCLHSDDPYLVENAAWALNELGCEDKNIHQLIGSLLDDSNQNRRALIRALSGLGVVSEVPKILSIINEPNVSPSLRGACIAAVAVLGEKKDLINQLENHLLLSNQNDRHCAIQDIIDAGANDLLPSVLKTPVAPYFRFKAVEALWPNKDITFKKSTLVETVDSILIDDPNKLTLLHRYEDMPSDEFLIEELFGTDFSRCYLALKTIRERDLKAIQKILLRNLNKAQKDYGALYFFINLFRFIPGWDDIALKKIEDFLLSALNDNWPQYMKFRPAAIIALGKFNPDFCLENMKNWLDEKSTPFWASRYAALMSFESLLKEGIGEIYLEKLLPGYIDSNIFVSKKKNDILSRFPSE